MDIRRARKLALWVEDGVEVGMHDRAEAFIRLEAGTQFADCTRWREDQRLAEVLHQSASHTCDISLGESWDNRYD